MIRHDGTDVSTLVFRRSLSRHFASNEDVELSRGRCRADGPNPHAGDRPGRDTVGHQFEIARTARTPSAVE